MTTATYTHNTIEYIVIGSDPKFLLLSGMHGDEHEVVDCQKKYIDSHLDSLPSFLFIPQASPTAMKLKTRKNAFGHDINRSFVDPPTDSEAADIMDIVSSHQFDLCINVHEDPDRTNSFYLYDTDKMNLQELKRFQQTIVETGTSLYSGIDDLEDSHLNMQIVNGYVSTPNAPSQLSEWLLTHAIAKRVLVPEIPGKAPINQKQQLVDAIMDFFIHSQLYP